eukprot:TRINITY_DN525_c0_g1_i9.p1 TRINITY_DN525_c0_g1~~TRINITY_DN525_c0_g1_i9.p1  ORF type:complete len:125 (+),score=9.89 TRINITY_DN525_c0_g1_i9:143-517(+)
MPLFTLISRQSDKTFLVESMDTEEHSQYESNRVKARSALKKMSETETSGVLSTDPPNFYFLYLIENNICYMTFCEKSYPRKLAYKFLEEVKEEFMIRHNDEVKQKKLRPYAFQQFGEVLPCNLF